MQQDELKRIFTIENFEKLYNYFANSYNYVCESCLNKIECKGKCCPCYHIFQDGKEPPVQYSNVDVRDCMDLDYGDCEMYANTTCYKCIHSDTGISEFKWDGSIVDY